MSGLVKAKKYNWQDSNLALFGSDTDKQVKKSSAETEPAWAGVGGDVGLKVWRIVKFKVTEWPAEDYGKFFSGDSYIILNTYKEDGSDELKFDVHFWIGQYSTQDEYGTAAYKTVELDTFLDDRAIQHREVMGYETELFKSYFSEITVMRGGADSGFRHVTPAEYKRRLLHYKRVGRSVTMTEVPCCKSRLKTDDVFVLDTGLVIYTWKGASSDAQEGYHAATAVSKLKSERAASSEVIEEGSEPDQFWVAVGEEDDDEDEVDAPPVDTDPSSYELWKVSDASGKVALTKVMEGGITRDSLGSDDVYILNIGKAVFVYVPAGASSVESKNGLGYAHAHLANRDQGCVPITVLKSGLRCPEFETAITAGAA